jgi:hypothetical protein
MTYVRDFGGARKWTYPPACGLAAVRLSPGFFALIPELALD